MQDQPDDIAVIQTILKGQPSAYAILVARYQAYVFTLAFRYVNKREIAEELAQDVFVKAYRFLADFKGNCKFSTWLYAIVSATCLSYLRKKNHEIIFLEEEKITAISDHTFMEKPSAMLEHKEQEQMIQQAMQDLTPADAAILTLFYLAEQSVDEIGIIMGLTVTNVKVRLFRARQKLKDVLERKYSRQLV